MDKTDMYIEPAVAAHNIATAVCNQAAQMLVIEPEVFEIGALGSDRSVVVAADKLADVYASAFRKAFARIDSLNRD